LWKSAEETSIFELFGITATRQTNEIGIAGIVRKWGARESTSFTYFLFIYPAK
jgi:hypothetical protein